MSRSTAYVPTLGDHWLRTEWSDKRSRLRPVHGTKQEAIKSLHDRIKFLTGRGWRVTTQKMLDDITPGERRMLVRIVPPAEYVHCGESVVEYRSCGGPTWCKLCETEQARERSVCTSGETASAEDDDPERARCIANFERGICKACGRPLRAHLGIWTRRAIADFYGERNVTPV